MFRQGEGSQGDDRVACSNMVRGAREALKVQTQGAGGRGTRCYLVLPLLRLWWTPRLRESVGPASAPG